MLLATAIAIGFSTTSSHWKGYYNALFIFKLNQLLTNRITATATTQEVGYDHVMATTDITQPRRQNDSMNEVAMGAIQGGGGVGQALRCT